MHLLAIPLHLSIKLEMLVCCKIKIEQRTTTKKPASLIWKKHVVCLKILIKQKMLLFLLLRAEILDEIYQSDSRIRENLQAVTKMPQKIYNSSSNNSTAKFII